MENKLLVRYRTVNGETAELISDSKEYTLPYNAVELLEEIIVVKEE